MHISSSILTSVACLALSAQAALAETYTVLELPVAQIGEPSAPSAGALDAKGKAIVNVFQDHHKFYVAERCRTHGTIICSMLAPSQHSRAYYAINDQGALAGKLRIDKRYWAVRKTHEGLRTVTPGTAWGINKDQVVVGETDTGQAFRFVSALQILPTLGGTTGTARGVNDAGAVVGGSATAAGPTHAFLYLDGLIYDLGTLPGGTSSVAYAVNASNTSVGCSTELGGTDMVATRFQGAGVVDRLGFLGSGAGSWSCAYALNGAGVAVGASTVVPGPDTHAFVHDGAALVDLNDQIAPADRAQWTLMSAAAINDAGQILVNALRLSDFTPQVLVLTPKP